ncbi:response regulator transcription factor [Alkaliphilus pronyensis]|uniref:Stage 0 sporulation protein A homolog n=1 Tax=Alkaliphilus pronyensis TaxID=1482732 RepID=A0A6I0EZF2_9FIRM|nr:response regulator transcription factor [Alkaliphilus pronyensis]KAB3532381.1 response regulator transcription factor [Alkaliphilus pronyensis]
MPLILIVEDEKRIQDIVSDYLKKDGYNIILADDGMEALTVLKNKPVDLMILDIMMPNLDGYSVCKQAREISNLPIIMLTAKQEEVDKLRGYELGADDYVTKPFSPNVLMAKVRVLLKRTGHPESIVSTLQAGKIVLNPMSREIFVNEISVDLTHTEYEILLLFMRNPKQVFSRDQLLNRIWGYDFEGTSRTVDVHVKNLRRKLGSEGCHIVTLIRSGYKFEVSEFE